MILSHGYWQRRLGGVPEVIGRVMVIDSRPRTVIGVMPASFSLREIPADLILPLRFDPARADAGVLPEGFCCRGIARLETGGTLALVIGELAASCRARHASAVDRSLRRGFAFPD